MHGMVIKLGRASRKRCERTTNEKSGGSQTSKPDQEPPRGSRQQGLFLQVFVRWQILSGWFRSGSGRKKTGRQGTLDEAACTARPRCLSVMSGVSRGAGNWQLGWWPSMMSHSVF